MVFPILYSFRRCPYAMRARLALQISGQQVELREVRLRDKPMELLAASPKGTVPVLIDADGSVIDESLDIMRWALQRNDPEGWLRAPPASADELHEVVVQCDETFKSALDRYKYPQRFADIDRWEERERGANYLRSLEFRLGRASHLSGNRASMADFAILPFVRQFAMVDRDWFEAQSWPRLRGWLAEFTASPLFAKAMIRMEPWSPTAPGVTFPAKVHFD